MAYCRKCGEELPGDAEFCPNCGVSTTSPKLKCGLKGEKEQDKEVFTCVKAVKFFGILSIFLGVILVVSGLILYPFVARIVGAGIAGAEIITPFLWLLLVLGIVFAIDGAFLWYSMSKVEKFIMGTRK